MEKGPRAPQSKTCAGSCALMAFIRSPYSDRLGDRAPSLPQEFALLVPAYAEQCHGPGEYLNKVDFTGERGTEVF